MYMYATQKLTPYMCVKMCKVDKKIGSYVQPKIKTYNSESRGQEEARSMRRTSELFTVSTTMKLANALNKPP